MNNKYEIYDKSGFPIESYINPNILAALHSPVLLFGRQVITNDDPIILLLFHHLYESDLLVVNNRIINICNESKVFEILY